MSDSLPAVVLRSPPDLLGMVPYLLGFHPRDSVVAVYMGQDHRVWLTSRLDLDAPPDVVVDTLRGAATHSGAWTVVIVGYGPRSAAAGLTTVADQLTAHVTVSGVFLVADGQYVCLSCPCQASGAGVPFDAAATATAARSTVEGLVALPGRADLLALVEADPVEQAAVSAAIADTPLAAIDDGQAVLRHLMDQAADGIRLSTEQVARLVMLLRDIALRDVAWRATAGLMWQRDLWLDVTRRAPEGFVAAPASLAAWCAWMRGEETLAGAALDRALTADPGYGLARLIGQAVAAHLPARDLFTAWPPTGPGWSA